MEGEKSVPKGETVYLEKPPMDVKSAPHCAGQTSKPSQAQRELRRRASKIFTNPVDALAAFKELKKYKKILKEDLK